APRWQWPPSSSSHRLGAIRGSASTRDGPPAQCWSAGCGQSGSGHRVGEVSSCRKPYLIRAVSATSPPPAAYMSNLWVVARKTTLRPLPVTPRNWYVTTPVTSFDQRLVTGNGTCSYTRY